MYIPVTYPGPRKIVKYAFTRLMLSMHQKEYNEMLAGVSSTITVK